MNKSHFRFSKQILRRLGEELNYSIDANILELVKNGFDADAKTCTIELINVDHPGGTLRISDDGDGMTEEDLTDGFLIIGESRKQTTQRTPLNRIPAGSKGLGRIAALRMGDKVAIQTSPKGNTKRQYSLELDWGRFVGVGVVEDVPLYIDNQKNPAEKSGTTVTIKGLKSKIRRIDVKRLARSLILLADPFKIDPSGFRPVLRAPEFRDLERLIGEGYFKYADYHLQAAINHDGIASLKICDGMDHLLVEGTHEQIRGKAKASEPYECPPAEFDFWVYALSTDRFVSREVTLGEVKEWLKEVGGVHLYQNGLRVSPYGDPGNDWLGINLLRVRNPELRPGTESSIGRIKFEETAGLFIQKTDRAGYIETTAFDQLKEFAQSTMEWMAKWRTKLREEAKKKKSDKEDREIDRARSALSHVAIGTTRRRRKMIREATDKVTQAYDEKIKRLKDEVILYRSLASAGIVSATFAHELTGNAVKVLNVNLKSIEKRAKEYCPSQYDGRLKPPIEKSLSATNSLATLGSCILKLLQHEKRRQGRIEYNEAIRNFIEYYRPIVDARQTVLELDLYKGDLFSFGSQSSVEAILVNLINNALNAFVAAGDTEKVRTIRINTNIVNHQLSLSVSDNGPGIIDIDPEDIWLPGQTTRNEGTGLGLTIVKDTVEDMSGTVKALGKGELNGVTIMVYLPLLGGYS